MVKGEKLSSEFCDLIIEWMRNNPGDYLEIGSYYGVFLVELAEKFPENKLFSIEPFITDAYESDDKEKLQQEVKEYFNHNIEGLGNIIHWDKKTIDCLNDKKYEQLKNLTCILIDGSHKINDIIVDINFINNIQNDKNILVIIDDLHVEDVLMSLTYFEQIFHNRIMIKTYYSNNFVCYILKPKKW